MLDPARDMCQKCEEYLDKGDFLELSKTDLRFHRVLVSGARNEYLSELYKRYRASSWWPITLCCR